MFCLLRVHLSFFMLVSAMRASKAQAHQTSSLKIALSACWLMPGGWHMSRADGSTPTVAMNNSTGLWHRRCPAVATIAWQVCLGHSYCMASIGNLRPWLPFEPYGAIFGKMHLNRLRDHHSGALEWDSWNHAVYLLQDNTQP